MCGQPVICYTIPVTDTRIGCPLKQEHLHCYFEQRLFARTPNGHRSRSRLSVRWPTDYRLFRDAVKIRKQMQLVMEVPPFQRAICHVTDSPEKHPSSSSALSTRCSF